MFDRKNGKKDEDEDEARSPLFSPFSSLRRSFRKLKTKKVKRNLSEDTSSETKLVNLENKYVRFSIRKPCLKKENLACPHQIKKKTGPLNGKNLQFSIIEWSSCESLSDNSKYRSRKTNSLRRSKASILVPLNTNRERPKTAYLPQKTKINRYNSMNILNDPTLVMSQNRWYSTQNVTENNAHHDQQKSPNQSPPRIPKAKNEVNKLRKLQKRKRTFNSLPNISESNCKIVDNNDNILTKKRSVTSDVELCSNVFCSETTCEDTLKNDIRILKSCSEWSIKLNKERCFSAEILNQDSDLKLINSKRLACSPENLMHYASSVSLTRPPVPSVPKPINKRDRHLKSASTEYLSSKKSVLKPYQSTKNEHKILAKTLSDKTHSFSDIRQEPHSFIETEITETDKVDLASLLNEKKVDSTKCLLYQLPLAIAEAVFDHSSLRDDELSFVSGDVITVLFMEDDCWWWGAKGENDGWFPASYVRLRVVQEIEQSEPNEISLATKASKISLMGLRARANDSDKSMTVRAKCVEELLTTEVDYGKLLKNVIEGYLQRVREDDLFTTNDSKVIFGNIEQLYTFHKEFVEDLQRCIDHSAMENSCVGATFLKHQSRFKIYSEYCNNQPRSSARLSTLSKNKKVEFFLESCRLRQNMIRLSLDGFLLSPVQRICKYPLQLKELLKHTKESHPDYRNLQQARSCMQNVASVINERKRRLENVNKLARWQLTVIGWKDDDLVLKSSDIMHKGSLYKFNKNGVSERYVYMFDHQLVYFKRDNSKRYPLTYRGRINLDETVIESIKDNTLFSRGDGVCNAWKMWNNVKQKWCFFCVKNSKQKSEWLKAFQLERKYVEEEEAKGFLVLPEVRLAAIENAYKQHAADLKRKKIRRKSLATTVPVDVDLSPPYVKGVKDISQTDEAAETAVQKRPSKPWRNRSFRLSLQGTIFDRYNQQKEK